MSAYDPKRTLAGLAFQEAGAIDTPILDLDRRKKIRSVSELPNTQLYWPP